MPRVLPKDLQCGKEGSVMKWSIALLELDRDTTNAVENYVDYLMEFGSVGHG